MSRVKIRLDPKGIREVLNSAGVASAVHDAAVRVAGGVQVDGPVEVSDYRTDRAASAVTIVDVRGRVWQVRDGVLTRAASGAGLDIGGIG